MKCFCSFVEALSRTRESFSSKSDNTEVAVSFDEPAQVETLSSIAKSKVCALYCTVHFKKSAS